MVLSASIGPFCHMQETKQNNLNVQVIQVCKAHAVRVSAFFFCCFVFFPQGYLLHIASRQIRCPFNGTAQVGFSNLIFSPLSRLCEMYVRREFVQSLSFIRLTDTVGKKQALRQISSSSGFKSCKGSNGKEHTI